MTDQEVPAPDAAEQAQPVATDPSPRIVAPALDAEVPEADALEQAIEEPVDEGDELR